MEHNLYSIRSHSVNFAPFRCRGGLKVLGDGCKKGRRYRIYSLTVFSLFPFFFPPCRWVFSQRKKIGLARESNRGYWGFMS